GADDRGRLSVRLLARPLCAEAHAANAARARDPAVLDELSAARLLMAEHPRRPGCDQPVAAVAAPHGSPGLVLSLRPARGRARARLPLFPFRSADAVRVARALRLGSVQGGHGPRRAPADGDAADPPPADQARAHDRGYLRLHP